MQIGRSAQLLRQILYVLKHCSCNVLSWLESLPKGTGLFPVPSPVAPTGRGGAELPPELPRLVCLRFQKSQASVRVWEMSTQAWYLQAPFRHQLLFLHRLFPSCCQAGFTQKRPSYLSSSPGRTSPARISSGTFG